MDDFNEEQLIPAANLSNVRVGTVRNFRTCNFPRRGGGGGGVLVRYKQSVAVASCVDARDF